jgi:hypothetical protein
MRALQRGVCIPWQPDLTVDNHATNGSVHRFDMTVDVPHTVASGRVEPIEFMRDRLVPEVMAAVKNRGFESGWYGNFVEDERLLDAGNHVDPGGQVGEGWMTYPHHPRFGSNYRGLTNRLDLLLECYSYLSFERRVATASAWQIETLQWVAAHADDVLEVVAAHATPPKQIAVRYRLDRFNAPIEVLTRTPRTLDGAPSSVQLPHFARFVGSVVVERPAAYLVPPAIGEHLIRHGLAVSPVQGKIDCVVAKIESVGAVTGRGILEAAGTGDLGVSWHAQRRDAPPGWARVSTAQPLGAIAVYLCEPQSDDGLIENGLCAALAAGDEFPVWRLEAP